MNDLVAQALREKTQEHRTYLDSEMAFGVEWTRAATHTQRLHRLDHVFTGFPWTYADGPEGFSADHPFGDS